MDLISQEIEPGVWLVDKPTGVTSHKIVDEFRRRTGEKHVGHAGTLDPLATGLLIILVGRGATRRQDEFLHADKTYQVELRLGIETDSYDSDGKVTAETPWEALHLITETQVRSKLPRFTGEIAQTVPAFSAVRVHGRHLYKSAHRGQVMPELPSRQVVIHELKLLNFTKDIEKQRLTVSLEVNCGAGTYIRSLVHDLGLVLGVHATVIGLRRLKIGSQFIGSNEFAPSTDALVEHSLLR